MKIADISVECVQHMGSDIDVVNAARVSFAKESQFEGGEAKVLTSHDKSFGIGVTKSYTSFEKQKLSDKDAKLIKYLADHNHWSPFAHAFLKFRIKAPIFVARQLVKHQIGLAWNEVSRRYVDSAPEFYMPEIWRGKPVNGAKQGSHGEMPMQGFYESLAHQACGDAVDAYELMIEKGVAPEQARMVLPQNMMTEWIWSGSLFAFARVCNLRLDPHAQKESRDVATGINEAAFERFPVSWQSLVPEYA